MPDPMTVNEAEAKAAAEVASVAAHNTPWFKKNEAWLIGLLAAFIAGFLARGVF